MRDGRVDGPAVGSSSTSISELSSLDYLRLKFILCKKDVVRESYKVAKSVGGPTGVQSCERAARHNGYYVSGFVCATTSPNRFSISTAQPS